MKDIDEFGLTNNKDYYDAALAFRQSAIDDGWIARPTYDFESIDRHSTLVKDGFRMHVMSRDNTDKPERHKYQASINIWGPDTLCIKPPKVYDWNFIKEGKLRCNNCNKIVDRIYHYSFAGRCCKECLPEMQKKHEYPGWSD